MGETPRHIVLVGMMGSGKTTVGRLVADRLGRPFLDTDAEVEAEAGRCVADVFATEGEAGFRARERAAVLRSLGSPVPSVIATGGGAVLDPELRRRFRHEATTVWLRATPAELARRTGPDAARPLLGADAIGSLTALADERAGAYEAAAGAVVDVDGLDPVATAGAVLGLAAGGVPR